MEWSDQERALREERFGVASANAESRVAQYRLLARILSEPAGDSLPHNFAALVAERAAVASESAGDRFELWGQRILLALFALTGIAFFAGDVVAWLQSVFVSGGADAVRRTPTVSWAFAIGLCIALSILIELWTSVSGLRARFFDADPQKSN